MEEKIMDYLANLLPLPAFQELDDLPNVEELDDDEAEKKLAIILLNLPAMKEVIEDEEEIS